MILSLIEIIVLEFSKLEHDSVPIVFQFSELRHDSKLIENNRARLLQTGTRLAAYRAPVFGTET